jgi:hypothetical protein
MLRIYDVRPDKDYRGVDLISDVVPFGRLYQQIVVALSDQRDLCV